ncbi:MAG TPA: hypothetical protein VN843_33640 [Anaerolineales bacterium]|nr:hypothetical protein [Anaerolineales bacterium]
MESWRLFWCFYNSIAFNSVSGLVLLGAFVLVLPNLFALRDDLAPDLGESHTEYIELKDTQKKTKIWGLLTLLFSCLTIFPYGKVLALTDGETCKVTVIPPGVIYYYIDSLYVSTVMVLLFFGVFYNSLQDSKKRYDLLKKKQESKEPPNR